MLYCRLNPLLSLQLLFLIRCYWLLLVEVFLLELLLTNYNIRMPIEQGILLFSRDLLLGHCIRFFSHVEVARLACVNKAFSAVLDNPSSWLLLTRYSFPFHKFFGMPRELDADDDHDDFKQTKLSVDWKRCYRTMHQSLVLFNRDPMTWGTRSVC